MSNVLVNEKINSFLQETDLQAACRTMGTWGLGSVVVRATTKVVHKCTSVKVETDQIMLPVNREAAMSVIADTLKKIARSVKDPALFDFPTATFAVEMYTLSKLEKWGGEGWGARHSPCLVFVTLRSVAENSTHVLLEGYSLGYNGSTVREVTHVRSEISARF